MTERTSVCVYVCTYRRNEQLATCLEAILASAKHAQDVADVGVVVIDDNLDGRARSVVTSFEGPFPLGLHYVHVGSGNISTARNAGLEAAIDRADWVAMTDDDCEPDPEWISELLKVQQLGDFDIVTGSMWIIAPPDSPSWMSDDSILNPNHTWTDDADGTEIEVAYTNNSMIRSGSLKEIPSLRFDPALGKTGGEDMVFYHQARRAGLRIGWAGKASIRSLADASRIGFKNQLRYHLWLGNSEAVTNRYLGLARGGRLLARGARRLANALTHLATRLLKRQRPRWQITAIQCTSAFGMMIGALGIRLAHPPGGT